jgi:predicted RNA-binding Zn-ribbon protein involved in translation (DUF1610 family)
MTEEIKGICWHCGHGLTAADYGRETVCPACGKETHICRNCRHFSPGRPNDCVEPMVERVLNKERANFCELFDPTMKPLRDGHGSEDAGALRKAAEDLFKSQ